ncbi:alpha-tubulin N-acetyltransferase 1-like [Lytechinus pictus]|uniref:alpha-tubulin N-acetyltransferase 1-like n=1 Tax=Lytechinus pictus TaxID=7653 RepID=UPI0030B9AE63
MEFPFNVNHLFGESIAVVDRNLRPYRTHSHGSEDHYANLEKVIDQMGIASSKAQGLNHVITTARRLRFTDNKLYVVTDSNANSGLGAVVGILKTGRKNLFVLDRHGNQTEMQPICVLDFYVHESCQRKGYGKKLFTHMLQAEEVKPNHLAIDRPSHKFLSFLMKHYNLRATISQVNNFVIFEGFFNNQPETSYCRKRGIGKPPVPPNNRRTHQPSPTQPHRNATSSGIWGTNMSPSTARKRDKEVLRDVRPPSRGSVSSSGSNDGVAGLELSGLEISTRGMGAHASSYSRYAHNSTPPTGRVGSGGSRRGSFTNSPITGSPVLGCTVGEENRRNSLDNPRKGFANGNQPSNSKVSSTPPPFGHIGAFSSYNSHLQAQTRNGHLKVSPNSTPLVNNRLDNQETSSSSNMAPPSNGQQPDQQPSLNPSGNYVISYTPQQKVMHSSWNVMGIPPGGQTRGSPQNQNNTPYKGSSAYQSPGQKGSPAYQSPGQKGSPAKQSPGYRNQHWSSHGIF